MAAVTKPTVLHPSVVVVDPIDDHGGTIVELPSGTNMVVGDIVLFAEEADLEYEDGEDEYRIIKECSIYGWYTKMDRSAPEPPV